MKTRNGFISNSSSTSFVVLLPENFDIEKDIDWEKIKNDLFQYNNEIEDKDKILKAKELINRFIIQEYMDSSDEMEEESPVYVIRDVLRKYVVLSIENSPDGGDSINLIDTETVKNIMERKS